MKRHLLLGVSLLALTTVTLPTIVSADDVPAPNIWSDPDAVPSVTPEEEATPVTPDTQDKPQVEEELAKPLATEQPVLAISNDAIVKDVVAKILPELKATIKEEVRSAVAANRVNTPLQSGPVSGCGSPNCECGKDCTCKAGECKDGCQCQVTSALSASKNSLPEMNAQPKVTLPLLFDKWDEFDPDKKLIDDLINRVEVLEKGQLKEADVIRIVESNFAVMRIRRRVNGVTEEVGITNDVTTEEQKIPGFAGTFTVPKGGRIESIDVIENGQVVTKRVSGTSTAMQYGDGLAYRTVADNMTIYATQSPTVPDAYQVSMYNTQQLQSYAPQILAQPTQQRRGLLQRMVSPAISRRGSTCSQNSDGSWSCR